MEKKNNNNEKKRKLEESKPAAFGFGGFEATSAAGKGCQSSRKLCGSFAITLQEGVRPGRS